MKLKDIFEKAAESAKNHQEAEGVTWTEPEVKRYRDGYVQGWLAKSREVAKAHKKQGP